VSGNNNEQDSAISFGPFRLSPKARLLEKDGAPLHIGGRALDILIFLAERPGEVVDKRNLIKQVWSDVNVDEGSPASTSPHCARPLVVAPSARDMSSTSLVAAIALPLPSPVPNQRPRRLPAA
jgi:hypothetical protein